MNNPGFEKPFKFTEMMGEAKKACDLLNDDWRWNQGTDLKSSAVPAVVVGIDVREYSLGTGGAQQLLISTLVYKAIEEAIAALVRLGYSREEEPVIVQRTGDGALVVFDCWECFNAERLCNEESRPNWALCCPEKKGKPADGLQCEGLLDVAFSFLFSLNIYLWNASRVSTANGKLPVGFRQRFAMSAGDIHLISGRDGGLDCVGSALIHCARLLSIDSGAHFLLQQEIVDFIERTKGGVPGICAGQWGHDFHVDESPSRKIKYGEYRYADVFGEHSDRPLNLALQRFGVDDKRYRIGAHNSQTIDFGKRY